MHRKHIRATDAATGLDVDVPTAIWADGQFLIYLGGELFTQFVVQSHNTSTDNAVARWDGTTGHLIQDSTVIIDDAGAVTGVTTMNGVPPGDWVRGPAAGGSTDNAITRWDGTTGRLVQNSVVIINDTGDITGVTSINTVPVGDFVRGPTPATATDNALARWDATTGRLIQNSLIIVGDTGNASGFLNISCNTINSRDPNRWVDGPLTGGATNNHIALWDTATGRLIKDSVVSINTGGDISTPGDMTPATVGGVGVGLLVKSSSGTPHPDNAVARWDVSAGHPIQDSTVFLDDSGNFTGVTRINTREPNLWVEGPISAIANNVPIFNGTSGRFIYDSGLPISIVVAGPGASTDNAIARWDGTSGFDIQNSLVIIDDTGAITGATTLNTKIIANLVVKGAGSYVVNDIPYFNDTTGTVIRDSGVNINNVVRNESFVVSVDNTLPRFDGITGKLIQNSGIVVADTTNNVTGLGSLNTRNIAQWVDGPVSATNNAIPAFNGTSGKAVYDSGIDVFRVVLGPASGGSTNNTLAVWDGTGGRLLKDGSATAIAVDPSTGIITTPVGVLVHSGASHTDNAVVRWDGTGAHTQDSTVIVDDSGNVTGLGTLNTRTIANWTESSSTFPTVGRILVAAVAGTRQIQPTGVLVTDFVTAAANFGTDNRVLRSDGVNKASQASAVTLDDSGNLTGVGTINGLDIPGVHCDRTGGINTSVYTFPLSGEWTVTTYIGYASVTGTMVVTVTQSGAGFNGAHVWSSAQGGRITSSGGSVNITNSGIPAIGVIQILVSSIPAAPGDTLTISITNCFVNICASNGLKI